MGYCIPTVQIGSRAAKPIRTLHDWVQAVKNENDSWAMFEASTEIPFEMMEKGASLIPLGELFSIKRSGKHKFRQYALGNLLKEGKDFGETFSSTVSGDGLRWFCSLACSCKKVIKGWVSTNPTTRKGLCFPTFALRLLGPEL